MNDEALNGYLIDTSVLSILAPEKLPPAPEFIEWIRNQSARLYIPCIAIAELEQGICKLRRSGGSTRADRLSAWLDGLIEQFSDHVLFLDAQACRIAGQISDTVTAAGRHPGFPDVAIAALAQQGDLMVLTRNVRHFVPLGVVCTDPTERLPA